MMIVRLRKLWFALSGLCVLFSIGFLFFWGLNLGIDFTGGSLMEVSFEGDKPDKQTLERLISQQNIETSITTQEVGDNGYIIRLRTITEDERGLIIGALSADYAVTQNRFETIGPAIGQELQRNAIQAILLVLIAIVIFVAWSFRKVAKPVSPWIYGGVALIALFHDVLITVGVFSLLGKFFNMEIGLPFVAALLTVLGYSVNDTIVVFDRVRENIHRRGSSAHFPETVGLSVSETLTRSVNTSLTTLLVLCAILIFGGASVQSFILALLIGIIAGTYSSIFLASPLLIVFYNKFSK